MVPQHARAKELGRFFGSAVTAPLSDFRGLIGGQSFTPEIYQECFVVNRYYGNRVTEIMTRRQQLLAELEKANAEIEAHKQDAEARKELFFRRNQASAALNMYDKRAGEELKALVNELQKWSSSKNGTRPTRFRNCPQRGAFRQFCVRVCVPL